MFGREMGSKLDNVEPRPRCKLEYQVERLCGHQCVQAPDSMTIR
jgi:hypothetical protein